METTPTETLLAAIASLQTQLSQLHQIQLQTLDQDRRFFTRLSDLPKEVVSQILKWIQPEVVTRYRRVSRAFDTLIREPSFARDIFHLHGIVSKETTSKTATLYDKAYFGWPIQFQLEYTQTRLAHLEEIDWRSTTFAVNCIPPGIGQLSSHLVHLTLYRCRLTGCIPQELGDLRGLVTLRLDDNNLTGIVPTQLGKLVQLVYLCLDHNKLTGPIPSELGKLVNLKLLNLKANSGLVGNVPPEFRFLEKLQNLYLNGEGIEPIIPPEIVAGTVVYNLLRRDGFR
ncbi:hypothetical protein BDR26DRAFT_1004486 [Obelidium mucronatum]|nr:hypothetical protein BDR26DRAFT_1004486 [Obelidium mucronatum]